MTAWALMRSPATSRPESALLVPGVFNALTARIAQNQGFSCVYLSGTSTAAANFGLPDIGIVGRQEMVETCRRVTDATSAAVIADADTGYGGPAVVRQTVREFIAAGAAAITIEDQLHQKQCGYTPGVTVASVDELHSRIAAACAARGDHDLAVIGRTDALGGQGLDSALERARAMVDAGADVAWILGLQQFPTDELAEIRSQIPGRALIDYTELASSPPHDLAGLSAAGFDIVLVAMSAMLATVKAVEDVFSALRAHGDWMPYRDALSDFERYNDLAGFDQAAAFEAEILRRDRS